MCIIVDANMAFQVFGKPPHEDGEPILRWLLMGDGVLVYGGKLSQELFKNGNARTTLVQLKKAGKAVDVEIDCPGEIEKELESHADKCVSNDAHVIVLGRISGARVLATKDQAAMDDFRRKDLIDNPRGKIYQRKEHHLLLSHSPSCGK